MQPSNHPEASATNPLEAILEALPVAAAVFARDGALLFANLHFRDAIRLHDQARVRDFAESLRERLLRAAPEGGIPLTAGDIPVKANARRLEDGRLLVWLEEQWAAANHRRRTEFLSIASHDLRGSIANARSYGSLLLSPRMELNERARHCAEVIRRNSDRALRLLGECFDLFLHDLHALDLDATVEDLSSILGEVVDRARSLATDCGVRLLVQMPPHLPSANVDRARLSHAAFAFAAHSIGRARKGELVRFEVSERPDSVLVEVSDEAGAAGDVAKLFDPEFRAISEGKLGEGFRLGLARATIEAHGGEVGARSSTSSASTFYFVLPLERDSHPVQPPTGD